MLLCGTGLGMSYAANRHPHVRAAVAWTPEIAALAREHNDANVLVLPARFVTEEAGRRHSQGVARHAVRRRASRAARREDRARSEHQPREPDATGPIGTGARPATRCATPIPRSRRSSSEEIDAAERRHRADRERELRVAGRARGDGHRRSRTSTPRGCRESATTAAAKSSTRSSSSRSIARSSCSAPITRTCSRTPARRRTAAVFLAFLKPGDTFLGMDLSHGGHLTHGSPVNFSGMLYKAVSYGVDRRRAASTTTTCARRRASTSRR